MKLLPREDVHSADYLAIAICLSVCLTVSPFADPIRPPLHPNGALSVGSLPFVCQSLCHGNMRDRFIGPIFHSEFSFMLQDAAFCHITYVTDGRQRDATL